MHSSLLFLFIKKNRSSWETVLMESGSVLSSRAVTSQVLSALKSLTSVFGMGTGGSSSPLPPEIVSFSAHPDNCTRKGFRVYFQSYFGLF